MIIAREDVRALFSKGVLWLSAGSRTEDRLKILMYRLADMVYETVLKFEGRAPRAPDIGVDPEDGAAYVRKTIGDDGHQILIVADDVWEAEILEKLTSTGTSVLYTTRADYLLGDAPLRLDEIDPHEAETVLRGAAEIGDTLSIAEEAHELAKRCGPSIMDLAFVGRWPVVRRRVDDEAWRTSMDLITDAQKDAGEKLSLSWRAAVLRAGLRELKQDSEKTKVLYFSMAVMPEGFAFALEDAAFLLHGEECSPDILEGVKWILMAMERFAIVARQVGGLYRLHSLHAEFIREEVTKHPATLEKAQARWQKYVSSVHVLLSWPLDELADVWRAMGRPGEGVNASAYDAAIETMGASDPRLPNALRRVAYLHWLGGDREKACNKWTKLLAIQENKQLSKEYPDLVFTLHNFGLYQKSVGHIKEAEEWLTRALPVAEDVFGGDHPQVADILHHLAWCSSTMGQTENAEWHFWSALNIREAKLGVNHPDVANTLRGLGLCMLKMRRTREAEDLLDRALAIYKDHFGATHSKVGRAVYDLGRCAHMVGRVKDAECLYREAMSTQEKNGEAAGGELADTLHALGGCLSEAERIEEADELYRRALAVRESILPTDHPDVARVVYALGKCTYELGRTHEAEGLCRRALLIAKKVLGSGHPAVADILHTLGACAIVDEQVEKGSELLTQALAIYQDQLEPDESKVAHVLYDLGRCASKAGNTKKAEQFYCQALEVEEKNLGADDPEVATIIYALGGCASKEGREEEAEALYRRALTIRAENPGVDYTEVAEALHVLGNCVMLAGKVVEAKVLYRQALDVLEENLPPDHPDIKDIKLALGSCETAVFS